MKLLLYAIACLGFLSLAACKNTDAPHTGVTQKNLELSCQSKWIKVTFVPPLVQLSRADQKKYSIPFWPVSGDDGKRVPEGLYILVEYSQDSFLLSYADRVCEDHRPLRASSIGSGLVVSKS